MTSPGRSLVTFFLFFSALWLALQVALPLAGRFDG
jgi:hypothetical protein